MLQVHSDEIASSNSLGAVLANDGDQTCNWLRLELEKACHVTTSPGLYSEDLKIRLVPRYVAPT
jgi:hypothetical protein